MMKSVLELDEDDNIEKDDFMDVEKKGVDQYLLGEIWINKLRYLGLHKIYEEDLKNSSRFLLSKTRETVIFGRNII